jgi:hypothetical protein
MTNWFQPPVLTPSRITLAFVVALSADAIQIALGPLGWLAVVQLMDVAAAIAITLLVGFHPLLLPTFVAEVIPVVDMLPTWTACLAVVVALRRKQQVPPVITPHRRPASRSDIIDV